MFPEDTSYGEDLLFNFAYLQCCRKIIFKKKPIYYYNHDNETSLSHKYRDNLFENGLRLNSAMKNFAIDKGLMTKELAAYYSLRVFDDAYNSLFDVWSTRCTLNICAKLRRTREIMNHIDVQEVVKFIELGSYSKLYVRIIKYRLAILFAGIRLIARCFRNNGGE